MSHLVKGVYNNKRYPRKTEYPFVDQDQYQNQGYRLQFSLMLSMMRLVNSLKRRWERKWPRKEIFLETPSRDWLNFFLFLLLALLNTVFHNLHKTQQVEQNQSMAYWSPVLKHVNFELRASSMIDLFKMISLIIDEMSLWHESKIERLVYFSAVRLKYSHIS